MYIAADVNAICSSQTGVVSAAMPTSGEITRRARWMKHMPSEGSSKSAREAKALHIAINNHCSPRPRYDTDSHRILHAIWACVCRYIRCIWLATTRHHPHPSPSLPSALYLACGAPFAYGGEVFTTVIIYVVAQIAGFLFQLVGAHIDGGDSAYTLVRKSSSYFITRLRFGYQHCWACSCPACCYKMPFHQW